MRENEEKQTVDKITVILVVLSATWGAMFNVMKIVEMKNGIRNLILDIDSKGKGLSKDNKNLLLYYDYIPISVGLFLFLLIFTFGVVFIPLVYSEKAPSANLTWPEALICMGVGLVTTFAMIVDFVASWKEKRKMRDHINSLP